ncbi:MAG: right-handed parallel beta-helix repeat-containing protein, partial [Lentisphaeria bacterium]|nr:right-handed parallel beta-helix repeat-containing protein [Lentisphaeria bacterium]
DKTPACIRLRDREHIVIENFTLLPQPGFRWMNLDGTRHCVVRNCHMENARNCGCPIRCRDSHLNRYENIRCLRASNLGKWGHVSGDMWNNFNCSQNVFFRVYISRAGHRPFGLWFDCPNNVVRECVFDCRWGRNFEFFSTVRLLMERCVVTNGFDGSGSADGRAKLFIIDSIFRRNLIIRNHYGAMVINAYKYQDLPTFGMLRSRVYHNTWYRNQEFGFQMADIGRDPKPHMVAGNIFKNNVFAHNDPGGEGLALKLAPNIASDNRFVSNILFGSRPGAHTVRIAWPGNEWLTTEQANQHSSGYFADNIDADPLFQDASRDDYRIRSGSPAIDAGQPLTVTRTAGKGRVVAVADARWFYDGFGIPGEEGDLIRVGGSTARVIEADIEVNTLRLDHEIEWGKGDAVTLPFAGRAPDMGAFENGMEQPWPGVPPGLRLETMETATRTLVATDFEAENLETWHYYWNFSRQRNADSRLDTTTAGSGLRSVRVYATKQTTEKRGSHLSCDIRPRWWDIDRFPIVRFRYRIPKGVPVGCWLHSFRGLSDGKERIRVCVGGTDTRANGGCPDLKILALVDDDTWREAELDARAIRQCYPDVKLLQMFRFYSGGKGRVGDQFWFDDFHIVPVADESAR